MVKISVVILNWNGESLLGTFLESVVRNSPPSLAHVVVADNGSTDGSLEYLRRCFPQIQVIVLEQNYGFTGGYNRAIAQIETPYCVLLNSDVEVTTGWLEPLVARLEALPLAAAVMPKILSYRQKDCFEYAGAAGGWLDAYGFPFCRGRVLGRIERDRGQWDDPCEVFWASGAAMMVRTDLYRQVGGFDEMFFAHMEEIDLCWRFKNKGYSVWAEPSSVVYHLGGATLSNDSPWKLFLNFRNSLYMLYKNLPEGLLRSVLLKRMLIDGVIACVYLLTLRFACFMAVWKAHGAFWRSLTVLKDKRMQAQPSADYPLKGMYCGSILLKTMKKIVNKNENNCYF